MIKIEVVKMIMIIINSHIYRETKQNKSTKLYTTSRLLINNESIHIIIQ